MVGQIGVEPTVFLMSRFYRPLQSPAMRTDPYGGTGWNRTNDTLGFNQVLYQLSYSSIWRRAQNSNLTPCGAIRLAGGPLTAWRHPNKMAGIGRLEHPRAVLETAVLPVKLYPCMMMVMPAGFEPSITSLRGLRPHQLDEGTRWRYGSDSNRRITVLQAALLNLLSTVSWLG